MNDKLNGVTRVLVADSQPLARRGLAALLATCEDIELVGLEEDGAHALGAALRLKPHVLITELELSSMSGTALAGQVMRAEPNIRTMVLTGNGDRDAVFEALRVGVYAYVLKSCTDEALVQAIRLVRSGKRLLAPGLVDMVMQQFQVIAQRQVRNDYHLSDADVTLLRLLARGATGEQLAREMHWSDRTVKRRIDEIIVKMEAKNRLEMIAIAVRRGLV